MTGARLSVLMAVTISACGGSSEPATSEPAGSRPEVGSCDGLADRWVEIQQNFLDELGDAPVADATAGPEVIEAGRRMGLLLLEHGRDIERVGCQVELAPGSPIICAHRAELTPRGPAGQEVVDRLGAACP